MGGDERGKVTRRSILRLGAGAAASALVGPLVSCTTGSTRSMGMVGAGAETVVAQGGWCWFQSARAGIGPDRRLWVGSTVGGVGGGRDGDVEVTALDLGSMRVLERHVLGNAGREDDHASPSILMMTSSRPQVAWASHTRRDWIEIGEVGRPLLRVHRPGSMRSPGRGVSYASGHIVGRTRWMLYRGEGFSWNLLTSTDAGRSWQARGLVVAGSGGQRPYVVAASDGRRLHLMATDGNPSEFRGTNVGYCTVDEDFTIRGNSGRRIGTVGSAPVRPEAMFRLFTGRRGSSEAADTDGWICDVAVIDNRPTAVLSVRDPWPPGSVRVGEYRHRYLWARQRGNGGWTVEDMAWAGSELYSNQPDYCGLGAVDPSNPQRVVVSTDVHPGTGVPLRSSVDHHVHHELFEGYRPSEGRWDWTALTSNSTADNLRPVIAARGGDKALLWMRGDYRHWTDFRTEIIARRI